MDKTITEQDMDAASRQFVQGFRHKSGEPDLDVDGLSESLLIRLLRLFRPSQR